MRDSEAYLVAWGLYPQEASAVKLAGFALVLVIVGMARADYVREREAAVALVKEGKTAEALAAFRQLAEGQGTDLQRSDALEQAALLCDRLKRPDEALDLARQIPLAAVSQSVQLQLLADHRQWREVVTQFGGEDLTTWPDTRIGPAAFYRGRAYCALRNGEAAVRDLRLACEYLLEDNMLGLAQCALGDAYRLIRDDENALLAYRQAYQRRNEYKRCQAALSATDLLRSQGRTAEALAELAVIPLGRVTMSYWRARLLMAWGATLAEAGRTDEAAAKYREVLALSDLPAATRAACEEALGKLGRQAE